jgi:hypothetical protein
MLRRSEIVDSQARTGYPSPGEDGLPRTRRLAMRPANSPLSPEAVAALDRFFSHEAPGPCHALRTAREGEFARLHALPDAALAAMGLSRDGLARYVFRGDFQR